MGSFGKFLGGLLVGAAVGAGAILFTAPQTGDETRSGLASYWDQAIDRGKKVAKDREAELWAEFNARVQEAQSNEALQTPPTTIAKV